MIKYNLIEQIQRGAFGTVFKIKHKVTGDFFVLKTIATNISSVDQINNEINIHQHLSTDPKIHPYIAIYYESFRDNCFVSIVMEYVDGYDMLHYINELIDKQTVVAFDKVYSIMIHLITGLEYIHKFKYAHRDIKPENIMMSKDHTIIKYIDFGLAQKESHSHKVGTLFYAPPEVFINEQFGIEMSQAHDIWSLGILFYLFTNLSLPLDMYEKDNITLRSEEAIINDIISKKIKTSKYAHGETINKVIDRMLTYKWKNRPSAEEVKNLLTHTTRCCDLV